jgi:cobyric acid synthase
MAEYAKADVYLVADIDRGGVFASVYGTMALLTPEERALIKGVIINKFRGDVRLFEEGRKQIESLAGVPVVGVLPFFRDIHIEEEDSVALRHRPREHKPGAVNIAIVHLPHMANFTDFAALERTTLHVYYTDDPAELAHAKVIILPGSKNTIGDLAYIRSRGLDRAIGAAESAGVVVVGICGGFQMMGLTVADPYGVEGEPQSVEGIGLLPVHTVLAKEKHDGKAEDALFIGGGACLRRIRDPHGSNGSQWTSPAIADFPHLLRGEARWIPDLAAVLGYLSAWHTGQPRRGGRYTAAGRRAQCAFARLQGLQRTPV